MAERKTYRDDPQGSYWVFTDFELDDDFWEKLVDDKILKYVYYGIEKCPTTGKEHYQGWCYTTKRVRWSYIRKLIVPRFVERMNGSVANNNKYCSKDGDIMEFGDRPGGQGKRSDLEHARQLVSAGANMRDVIDQCNSYMAIRCAELIMKYKETRRVGKPFVRWYYGPTGCSKSHTAEVEARADGDDKCWISMKDAKWMEGYDGHENVIFEEFRGNFCTLTVLLRLIDKYEYRVEAKGTSRQWKPKNIWFTSSKHPKDVYTGCDEGENINQLLRRIDVIKLFDKPYVEGTESKSDYVQMCNVQKSGVILETSESEGCDCKDICWCEWEGRTAPAETS